MRMLHATKLKTEISEFQSSSRATSRRHCRHKASNNNTQAGPVMSPPLQMRALPYGMSGKLTSVPVFTR